MKTQIVKELIETRINGNRIKGNKTYEAMLRRISKDDINSFADAAGMGKLYGTKLEMIEQIRNQFAGGINKCFLTTQERITRFRQNWPKRYNEAMAELQAMNIDARDLAEVIDYLDWVEETEELSKKTMPAWAGCDN